MADRKNRVPDRIAIDFGTSNTVISAWNDDLGDAETLDLPGWSKTFAGDKTGESNEEVSVIPSLIHFACSGRQWIGRQVEEQDLLDAPSTCLLYTSPSPRDRTRSRMPSSA